MKNHELGGNSSGEFGESNGIEWDSTGDVEFAGKKEFSSPIDYDQSARDRMLSEQRAKINTFFNSQKDNGLTNRESSVSQDFLEAQRENDERFRQQAERDYNVETYGANIPAAAARAAFDAEFFQLQRKINHEKRAQEKEKDLSAKDQAKAEMKRQKKGESTTAEERKHFREMEEIRAFGNKEDYGRRKEKAYREAQEAMKADRRGFKRAIKASGLSMPKSWDDPNTSLQDLQRVAWDTKHLLVK